MFATSRLLMSVISKRTFLDAPCRVRPRRDTLPWGALSTRPHNTRCSFVGISPLSKFGTDLLDRNRCKPAYRVWSQTFALIDVLPVPAARELLHDPRCLSAMT